MKIIGIIMRKESFEQCEKWFVNEAYITALQKLNAIIFPICDYASLSYAQEICHGHLLFPVAMIFPLAIGKRNNPAPLSFILIRWITLIFAALMHS